MQRRQQNKVQSMCMSGYRGRLECSGHGGCCLGLLLKHPDFTQNPRRVACSRRVATTNRLECGCWYGQLERTFVSTTKYVNYGGRGFWAYDIVLGVFVKYLIDAVEAPGYSRA